MNALSSITRSVQFKIAEQTARAGSPPAELDPTWFVEGHLPGNPENVIGVPAVETTSTEGMIHPANKVLKTGVGGAFWYNAAHGIIRARVAERATAAATLDVYNRVNQSSENNLGNYGGGAGSGGGGS